MTKHLLIVATALAMVLGAADMSLAKNHDSGGGGNHGHGNNLNGEVQQSLKRPSGGGSAGSEGPPEGHSLYCERVLNMPHSYSASTFHTCEFPSG